MTFKPNLINHNIMHSCLIKEDIGCPEAHMGFQPNSSFKEIQMFDNNLFKRQCTAPFIPPQSAVHKPNI